MNMNTPQIHTGPLVAADFDNEPWQLPHWMEQIEEERRQHEAAHAATYIGADDDAPSFSDKVIDWLTPRRFWALYVVTIGSAMLGVWAVLS